MVRSSGEDNKSNTEIWDLREALESTNINDDAIIYDAGLMSSVEVAYEIKDVTKYIIASACEILAEGFPYKRIMPSLIGKTLDLEEVCRSYYDFYASNSYSIKRAGTISLIKCSEMELLADTYKDFLREEYQALSYRNISGVQQYGRAAKGMNNMFFDISDFVSTVNETRSNYFEKVMNDIITYKNATSTFTSLIINKDSYSGLSVFIPSENSSLKLHDSYRNLKWYQKVYDFNNM